MLEGFSGLLSFYTQKLNRINVSSICGCCNSQIYTNNFYICLRNYNQEKTFNLSRYSFGNLKILGWEDVY